MATEPEAETVTEKTISEQEQLFHWFPKKTEIRLSELVKDNLEDSYLRSGEGMRQSQ